jgi:mono/diheme cytochrome c family protein
MKQIITTAIALFAVTVNAAWAADPRANWDMHCAQCHGKDGRADTKMGKQVGAKDLTDPKVQASFTNAQATAAIKDGVKTGGRQTMKPFGGKLSDADIKALVDYTRTLKK